jgi:ABC-type phosphate/phosphonate transport system permease subunit
MADTPDQPTNNVPGKQNVLPLPPEHSVIDTIWIIIVISFAIILVGAFVALAIAVFIYAKLSGDLLLSVFTTAAAFLAGLLTPSPTQVKSTQQ